MRNLVVGVALAGAGCESCEFSFGPIPLVIDVLPDDVLAEVTVCEGEGACRTLDPATASSTSTPYGATAPAGAWVTYVGWDEGLVCRYPELQITVTAPGCRPGVIEVPKSKPDEDRIDVTILLDCG